MIKAKLVQKIAVIGVGLIGGSIAMGLKKRLEDKITILGSCSSIKRSELAVTEEIIDDVLIVGQKIPNDIQIIILATPIEVTFNLLDILAKTVTSNALIIDIGSTKTKICQKAESVLPDQISFLGTHPMAGGEIAGFERADPDLFQNKPWILCPTRKTKLKDINLITNLVKILGAKPIIMEPKTHDLFISWASHLPLILSSVLFKLEAKQKNWKKILEVTADGFSDMTRLAKHKQKLKLDIINTNKKNVLSALLALRQEIDNFQKLIVDGDEEKILKYL